MSAFRGTTATDSTIRSDCPGGNVKVGGGVYSFPAARELGRNMLRALVRTAQVSERL